MNPLVTLTEMGQSVWLDYIRRSFLEGGELDRLIREDGVRGVTANPTIFEKAIVGSDDYDEALRELVAADGHASVGELYESLAIQDIRMAADLLKRSYDETGGADGFVSLEVSPRLAHDTAGTIAEARRLWKEVRRPNLMIKVPATPEGIPAIEELIADGVNVNVTLMFSLDHYEAVAAAYLRGVARTAKPRQIASVASFFVSRVDSAVDRALEETGTEAAKAFRGTVAIANAKRAYRRYRELFHGDAFAELRARGARPQRVLWASTGTKNPAYRDVFYVEELIGPGTVNTMPPATLSAFRDHGRPRLSLEEDLEEADTAIAALDGLGIDLDAITEQLQRDGVEKFSTSFDDLMKALEAKRHGMRVEQVATASYHLGEHESYVAARLERWQSITFGRRVWDKDPTAWFETAAEELTDRLGWLDLPEAMHDRLEELSSFALEVRSEGFEHVVVLGMGGSSLAPEVFAKTFGNRQGYPALTVLDTTHPDAVRALEERLDLPRTLFVVSSKSGTTLETVSLYRAFWDRLGRTAGRQFVAITDPDTPLEQLADARGFRRVFHAPADVGGRYSALSVFGLVPAALLGVDVHALLDRGWTMAEASSFCVPVPANPGLRLGAALGELALLGRNKVTFLTSPGLQAFPAWLEQLIAESTGKNGRGIVPVADEPTWPTDRYDPDRFFVGLSLDGDGANEVDSVLQALRQAGHPVARFKLRDESDLGQEMFRWEFAVAAAGAVLGIHPFDQPDVQLAKDLARQAMGPDGGKHQLAADETISVGDRNRVTTAVQHWLGGAGDGDYVGIQAYLAPGDAIGERLQQLRRAVSRSRPIATTLGYGPRFLHSTGQLHKGGPNTGLFLQLVDEPEQEMAVPETDYTFGALISAQALGDYRALRQRRRRVLRIHLGRDALAGLGQLIDVLG